MDSIALSTMMAEYYALSGAMREILPLRQVLQSVGKGMGISETSLTTFRTTVWEDNNGALALAKLDPGQHTARSRHFHVKTHWFRAKLRGNEEADDQGDIAIKTPVGPLDTPITIEYSSRRMCYKAEQKPSQTSHNFNLSYSYKH
jgi:hypothetical protein